MISTYGRFERARTKLRMHSQAAGFLLGLALAAAGALKILGEIRSSFLIGVGAAVIAASIFSYLSPFNEPAFRRFLSFGIQEFWPSRQVIDDPYWVDHLHEAKENCTLLGIAHGKWCDDQRFRPTLRQRLNHGVMFKMFFLNPECTAAELRAIEEKRQPNGRDTRDAIRKSIQAMWEFRQSLEAGLRERLRLYVYTATPSCGLTWIDKSMLITHYLAGLPDVTSPALLVTPPQGGMRGGLYDTYAKNLEKIENLSTVIMDENVQRFLPDAPGEQHGDPLPTAGPVQTGGETEATKGE